MDSLLTKRLRSIRERKGMTQKFVSSKLDIKPNTLSGYESGRREPDTSTLRALAHFYDVSVDYLIGNDKEYTYNFDDLDVLMFQDKEGFDELTPDEKQELWDQMNDQLEFLIDRKKKHKDK